MREVGDTDLDVCDDVEVLDLRPDDVSIKITHTGVCHSDVSALNGTIPQAPPAVLGHEGAGIIEEVGDDVDDLAPGDHVIVVWSPPCGECAFCTGRNQPNLCSNITFGAMARTKFRHDGTELFGMAGAGTFAEKTLMPRQGVVKIDPDIPLDVASLIGCGVMTGAGAAIYDMTRRGGTCCIVGVGRMEEMVSFNAFELFYNEKTLVGSYYGGTDVRSDFHRLLRLWKHGKLDLEGMITRRITIDEINPALEAVRNGEVVRQVIEF